MAFACITPALVTGSMAERMKLSAFVVWVALWTLLVYPLIAHWGFSPGGWRVAHAAIQISILCIGAQRDLRGDATYGCSLVKYMVAGS